MNNKNTKLTSVIISEPILAYIRLIILLIIFVTISSMIYIVLNFSLDIFQLYQLFLLLIMVLVIYYIYYSVSKAYKYESINISETQIIISITFPYVTKTNRYNLIDLNKIIVDTKNKYILFEKENDYILILFHNTLSFLSSKKSLTENYRNSNIITLIINNYISLSRSLISNNIIKEIIELK